MRIPPELVETARRVEYASMLDVVEAADARGADPQLALREHLEAVRSSHVGQ